MSNNTFIKNIGTAQTVLINNGKAETSGVKWDADYNGEIANVNLKLNDNGSEKQYKVEMTNEDLANMINVPSINKPIHNRLLEDFNENNMLQPMVIEIDNIKPKQKKISHHKSNKFLTHISSPNSFEDLIIPFTQPKTHRRPKTHIQTKTHRRPKTYRIIKLKKHRKFSPYKNHKTYRVIKMKKRNSSFKTSSRRSSRR